MATYQQQQQAYLGAYQSNTIPQQVPAYHQQQVQGPKPVLPRSISTTNLDTTSRCRPLIQQDWEANAPPGGTNFFTSTPCFTFTLPHLNEYPDEFRQFVFERLIDKETQRFMEAEHCLNWCRSTATLLPLYTTGDGNCLLHAASLGMWGFQDRDLILRRAVSHALLKHVGNTFNQRWRYSLLMEYQQQGWQLDPQQWEQEWMMTVQMASSDIIPGRSLDSLGEFHVFVLANVLRRPIIMYAGPKIRSAVNNATLQQLNFHGIYLPLLWDPKSCKKDPLPLGYNGGHFSALSVIDTALNRQGGLHLTLPLCDYYGKIFPVRFSLPVEDPMSLLMDYLDLIQVSVGGTYPNITNSSIICARLSIPEVPKYLKPLISGFIDACWEVYGSQQQHQHSRTASVVQQQNPNAFQQQVGAPDTMVSRGSGSVAGGGNVLGGNDRKPCVNGCGLYGSPDTVGMCSKCYRQAIQTAPVVQQQTTQTAGMGTMAQGGQLQSPGSSAQKCVNGCALFGSPNQLGMCSTCYRKAQDAAHAQERAKTEQQQQQQQPRQHSQQQSSQHSQQGSLPPGAIKCPHCANPGQPMYLGMCEMCYQGKKVDDPGVGNAQASLSRSNEPIYSSLKGASSRSQPPPPAVPPPRGAGADSTERSKCRMPGCEFFGTNETRFYCSRCFEKDMDRILKEADNEPAQQQQQQQYQPQQQYQQQQQQQQRPPADSGGFGQPLPHPSQPSPVRGNSDTPNNKPKCPKCNTYFGDDELGGICNGCFMQMTVSVSQVPPQHQHNQFQGSSQPQRPATDVHYSAQPNRVSHPTTAPQLVKCATCFNSATPGSAFCHGCQISQGLPEPSMNFSPPQRPVPKPRRNISSQGNRSPQHRQGITTAPVQTIPQTTGSPNCFMCNGGITGTRNEVCDQHKHFIMTQIQSPPPGEREEPVRQKPAGGFHHNPSVNPPYDQQPGDVVRSKNVGHNYPSAGVPPQSHSNYPYTAGGGGSGNMAPNQSQEFGVPLPHPGHQNQQHMQQQPPGYVQQQMIPPQGIYAGFFFERR